MSLFRRFLGKDPEQSIEYLCQLMAEQNMLLRELIRHVSGRPALSPPARKANESRIRTDKDVFRVDRNAVIREDLRKLEAEVAPWRVPPKEPLPTPENGQVSAPETPGNQSPPSPPERNLVEEWRSLF